jgi:hypothetical protein
MITAVLLHSSTSLTPSQVCHTNTHITIINAASCRTPTTTQTLHHAASAPACAAAASAPAGFDHAGASRVLLGAQQILRQLQASTTAAAAAAGGQAGATASLDDSNSTAASTVDELDEAESSMADDDDDMASDGRTASSSSSSGLKESSHADPRFAADWQGQLRKPGLLGALVAAAYPDRIAQLKPGSGGKPSYTLSTGAKQLGLQSIVPTTRCLALL